MSYLPLPCTSSPAPPASSAPGCATTWSAPVPMQPCPLTGCAGGLRCCYCKAGTWPQSQTTGSSVEGIKVCHMMTIKELSHACGVCLDTLASRVAFQHAHASSWLWNTLPEVLFLQYTTLLASWYNLCFNVSNITFGLFVGRWGTVEV